MSCPACLYPSAGGVTAIKVPKPRSNVFRYPPNTKRKWYSLLLKTFLLLKRKLYTFEQRTLYMDSQKHTHGEYYNVLEK